jgi:hypothetical protein
VVTLTTTNAIAHQSTTKKQASRPRNKQQNPLEEKAPQQPKNGNAGRDSLADY